MRLAIVVRSGSFKRALSRKRESMKVAISSSSFAAALAAGELTQLEWLERAAGTFAADGVVFAEEHFPRTDTEYLAQLKKIAVDCGLVPLAVHSPTLLDPPADESDPFAAIEKAAALGALFVIAPLPVPGEVPPATFVAAVAAAKAAVKAAKRVNVTILIEPLAGTIAPDLTGARHFLNDVDSAWLRYLAPASATREALGARHRVLAIALAPGDEPSELAEDARPWFILAGDVSAERMHAVRIAAAKKTLASAGVLS